MFRSKFLLGIIAAAFALLSFFAKPTLAQSPSFEFLSQTLDATMDIAVSGNLAYVTNRSNLYIFDISNPAAPVVLGNYHAEDCFFWAIDVADNIGYAAQAAAYFCDPYNSLYILDVSDPENPTIIGDPINVPGPGAAWEIAVSGNYVYIVDAHGGLKIIDIISREEAGSFIVPGTDFRDLKIVGNLAYLADLNGKMWVVDISNKYLPVSLDYIDLPGNSVGIAVKDSLVYVANGSDGIRVVDVSDPQNIFEAGYAPTPASDVEISGNYLFVAGGFGNVIAMSLSDPTQPVQVDSYNTLGSVFRVTVSGDLVFAADTSKGMVILRFSGLGNNFLLNVPLFKQNDPIWGGFEYDSGNSQSIECGSTMRQCGCATSSVAMLLKYYGIDKDPFGNATTPETVNNYFKRNPRCNAQGCISEGYWFGQVIWSAVERYSAEANKIFGSQKIILTGIKDYYDPDFVTNEILNERPVILRVPGREHWVVATGIYADTFLINDPFHQRIVLNDPAYQNIALRMLGYERTSSDFSRFDVTSLAPAQILVTDSHGRRTGFDPETSSTLDEIPGSSYTFEPAYADATEENPAPSETTGVYTVMISTPEQDNYSVKIISNTGNLYSFAVYGSDRDGGLDFNLFEDVISGQERHVYNFNYDPEPEGEPFVQNVSIDINSLFDVSTRKGSYTTAKVYIFSTPIFDAPNQVDRTLLTIEKSGAVKSLLKCKNGGLDVNYDGFADLICSFSINRSEFGNGPQTFVVRGETTDKVKIQGQDSVIIN